MGNFHAYPCDRHFVTDRSCPVSDPWHVVPLKGPPRLSSGHDINRFHKIFPYHVLPPSDFSFYLDGNVELLVDPLNLLCILESQQASIGFFRHPDNRCLHEEVSACMKYAKFDAYDYSVINSQINFYQENGFDINSEISANYFLLRRHLILDFVKLCQIGGPTF